nr:immunoglobulin light chain junction region [Macaca mulatta]MOW14432.1 immunoglobulin light chain junction region [Macaca mulatta]
CIQALEFPPTF